MAKVKYKDASDDVKQLIDARGKYWITLMSAGAFFLLGMWMIIDPSPPEHASVEKASVHLVKEMWGTFTGLIFICVAIPFMVVAAFKIKKMTGLTYLRLSTGYYLFDSSVRKSGLNGLYDNKHLIVFYPEADKVLKFENYTDNPVDKYYKPKVDTRFNCHDAYWSADSSGYSLFYNGKHVAESSCERKDGNLIVTSPNHKMKFKLLDYDNNKDNQIRSAETI